MSKSQTCKQIANTVWNKSHELNLTKGRLCKSSEEKVKIKKKIVRTIQITVTHVQSM